MATYFVRNFLHFSSHILISSFVLTLPLLRPLLQPADVEDVRPFGFGTSGVWKPIGLDNWFKFSKYVVFHFLLVVMSKLTLL